MRACSRHASPVRSRHGRSRSRRPAIRCRRATASRRRPGPARGFSPARRPGCRRPCATTSSKNFCRSLSASARSPSRATASCWRARTRTSRLIRSRSVTSRHMPSTCTGAPSLTTTVAETSNQRSSRPAGEGRRYSRRHGASVRTHSWIAATTPGWSCGCRSSAAERKRAVEAVVRAAMPAFEVGRPGHAAARDVPRHDAELAGFERGAKRVEARERAGAVILTRGGAGRVFGSLLVLRSGHGRVHGAILPVDLAAGSSKSARSSARRKDLATKERPNHANCSLPSCRVQACNERRRSGAASRRGAMGRRIGTAESFSCSLCCSQRRLGSMPARTGRSAAGSEAFGAKRMRVV